MIRRNPLRPVFFNLTRIQMSAGARTSITHRLNGVVLALGIYASQLSLASAQSYEHLMQIANTGLFTEALVIFVLALTFYQPGLARRRNVALRVIYLDAILYFFRRLMGTGHPWQFTGQTNVNMALSALFSALDMVPLTVLKQYAWVLFAPREASVTTQANRWSSRTSGRSIS